MTRPRTSEIILRVPSALKSRAVRLASANNQTLFVWMCEAMTEKAEREEKQIMSDQQETAEDILLHEDARDDLSFPDGWEREFIAPVAFAIPPYESPPDSQD